MPTGIAVTRSNDEPRPKEYCCFREEYLETNLQIHKTQQALGAFVKDFKMIQAPDSVTNLLPTGHFNTHNHQKPSLVIADNKKVVNDDNFDYDPMRALDLIEMTTIELVAQGELTNSVFVGAETKFSFWKAAGPGLYSLGSYFKMGHSKPGSILLLKSNEKLPDWETIFRRPDSFVEIFKFGDNTIWSLNCPAHYRALGVAVTNTGAVPDGEVYCIKAIFTDIPDWQTEVHHIPSNTDPIKIFKQRFSEKCQNLNTASAVEIRGAEEKIFHFEYCLKSKIANYRAEKPITKAIMTDVKFDMDNLMQTSDPGQLEITTVQNRGGIPQ